MNNIIICINTFGIEKTNVGLRFLCEIEEFSIVKSFLIFLDSYIDENEDPMDNEIVSDILDDLAERYHLDK